jgi:ATP-dependent Lhr-like helicase
MLARVRQRIVTRRLERVSPLAVPALLEISREMVARGDVDEEILRDNEDALIADAMRVDRS